MSYHDDDSFEPNPREVLWVVVKIVGGIILAALLIKSACERQKYRQHVRETCEPIRHISGDTVFVSTKDGVATAHTGDKTCYRCPPNGFEECF
jgi:hypothetical protein